MVQLYDRDETLFRQVADFLAPGLDGRVPTVIIATPSHRRAFLRQLETRGHDVMHARASGLLTLVDARECLGQFMIDGNPQSDLFVERVGGLLRTAHARNPLSVLRAYGEMVDLLWRDENPRAALALEELWVSLAARQPFTMLCAYDKRTLANRPTELEQACLVHTHVRDSTPPPVEAVQVQRVDPAIAERMKLERELKAQNEELARTVRFAEQFVTLLGHDLRNPLSAITTAAGLLRHRGGADNVVKPAQRILKNAERMSRMVDQLLDFTRTRLGKGLTLSLASSDLAEVCRVIIDGVDNDRVDLVVFGSSTGEWDSERLAQVVGILTGNALTYGQANGPVSLEVDGRDPGKVKLTVHNRGAIPAATLPFLFEPRELRQEGSSGLGLGLFISQQIALAHKGRLEVQSSEPSGTRFTLTLPRKLA